MVLPIFIPDSDIPFYSEAWILSVHKKTIQKLTSKRPSSQFFESLQALKMYDMIARIMCVYVSSL